MKKIISIALLVVFSLSMTGCTSEQWTGDISGMSEELLQKNKELLDEHLIIVEEDPENTESLFEVGFRYQQLGEYKNAEKYYKKVLAIAPFHYTALNNIANIYEEVGEYQLAADNIKTLYEKNPDNTQVLSDTIRILLKNDEPENAQDALENFASLNTDDSEGMTLYIGNLFQSIFDYKQKNANN